MFELFTSQFDRGWKKKEEGGFDLWCLTLIVVIFCRQSAKPSSTELIPDRDVSHVWLFRPVFVPIIGAELGAFVCVRSIERLVDCGSCTGSEADLRFWKSCRWYNGLGDVWIFNDWFWLNAWLVIDWFTTAMWCGLYKCKLWLWCV